MSRPPPAVRGSRSSTWRARWLGVVVALVGCGSPQGAPLPTDAPAWTVGPPAAPRPDGRAALVVYVDLPRLPVDTLESLTNAYNGGLSRLTSPDAARVLTRTHDPRWLVERTTTAVGLAVDPSGLNALGADAGGVWIDPIALRFASDGVPAWLDRVNSAVPLASFARRPWISLKPGVYAPFARDDAPGEDGPGGIGALFPHPAPTGKALDGTPIDTAPALRASPASGDALTAAAIVALDAAGSGRGDTVDLAVLSYDHVGHIVDAFSPTSWETLDALLRLDDTLQTLFRHLDRSVGPNRWSVVISAGPDTQGRTVWRMWGAGVTPGSSATVVQDEVARDALSAALGLAPMATP